MGGVAIGLSVFVAGAARADGSLAPLAATAPRPVAPAEPTETHVHSKAMIAVGCVLVALGAAQIVPGALLAREDHDGFLNLAPAIGATLIGVGVAHVIPGIILIGVGAKPDTGARPASVTAGIALQPAGGAFALHF
jgi:hypothetical protein